MNNQRRDSWADIRTTENRDSAALDEWQPPRLLRVNPKEELMKINSLFKCCWKIPLQPAAGMTVVIQRA